MKASKVNQVEILVDELNRKKVSDMTDEESRIYASDMQKIFGSKKTLGILQEDALRNDLNVDSDGNVKGMSHKDLCKKHSVNHYVAHKAMREMGWIDDNKEYTIKGSLLAVQTIMVGNEKNGFKLSRDIVPTFFPRYGSIFWNTENSDFIELWKEVLNKKVDGVLVSKTNYNDSFKNSHRVLGEQSLCALSLSKKISITGLNKDDKEIDLTLVYMQKAVMKGYPILDLREDVTPS